jgi:hypothetical protein
MYGHFSRLLYKIAAILPKLEERIAAAMEQMMAAMKSTRHGDLDHAGLVTLIEELAKTELSQKISS